jgi:CheY-like chemotaxis protein
MPLEWAAIFDGATGSRLAAVERYVASLPRVLGAGLHDCDLAFEPRDGWAAVILRLSAEASEADDRRRIAFWTDRAGARLVAPAELDLPELLALRAHVEVASRLARATTPDWLPAQARRILRGAEHASPLVCSATLPVLDVDLARSAELRWSAADGVLTIRSRLAPVPGDELELAIAVPGAARPMRCVGRVVDADRGEGEGVAFAVGVERPPPVLARALESFCAAALGAAPPVAEPAPGRRRALVVDDDPFALRLLGDALKERGFEVLTATDGDAGLRRLSEELAPIDLLLTDLRMGGMDGSALVRTVRRGGEADLVVVVVTGSLDPGIEPQLERDGATAVLDKALGPDIIANAATALVDKVAG